MISSRPGILGALKSVLYTLPEGSWTHLFVILEAIISGGVIKCTTRLTVVRVSRLNACETVRGKPSRMNDAVGGMVLLFVFVLLGVVDLVVVVVGDGHNVFEENGRIELPI